MFAWSWARAAAHGEPRHGVKPPEVDFIGRSALDPRPAKPLASAGEGQMNPTRLSLCRTDAHEPAIMRSSTGGGDTNKQRHKGHQKEWTHPLSRALSHTDYRPQTSRRTAGSSSRRLHSPESGRFD